MQEIFFSIKNWTIWTPTHQSKQDWINNAKNTATDLYLKPELDFLPKMTSRRLSQLTKMSLQVAFECTGALPSLESVFASRFGEWNQTFRLMQSISDEEEISPSGFSLSVHNTAAGIYSITNNNKTPYTAVAANELTFEAALIEALGKLEEQKDILLVIGEENLPEIYSKTFTNPLEPFAMAFLLSKDLDSGSIVLKSQPNNESTIDAFDFLKWLLSAEKQALQSRFFSIQKL